MTEGNENLLAVPTIGMIMHSSGLYGLERGTDGMVRAIGPGDMRSRYAVIEEVAKTLIFLWMPTTSLVTHLLSSDAEDEALDEAHQFVRAWDLTAQGQTMAWMAGQVREYMLGAIRFSLDGIAKMVVHEDGLIHLALPSGETSVHGIRPEVAWAIVSNWDGLDGAADLATEHLTNPYDRAAIGNALVARWEAEASNLEPNQREQTHFAALP